MERTLASTDTYLHLYGKKETRIGRKMGHITVVGSDIDILVKKAADARISLEV